MQLPFDLPDSLPQESQEQTCSNLDKKLRREIIKEDTNTAVVVGSEVCACYAMHMHAFLGAINICHVCIHPSILVYVTCNLRELRRR